MSKTWFRTRSYAPSDQALAWLTTGGDPTAQMDDRPADTPAGEDADWAEPRAVAVAKLYLARLPAPLASVHHHRFVLGRSQDAAAKALNLTRQRLRTLEKKLRSGLARELKRAGIPTKG